MITIDSIFGITGNLAMLGWVILLFAPRRWQALNIIPLWIIPCLLSGIYAGLILTHFFTSPGGYDTFEQVKLLLSNDWLLLAGWIHYLAFDLCLGSIIAYRLDRIQIDRLIQAPILIATLLFGPLGFVWAMMIESGMRLHYANKDSYHA